MESTNVTQKRSRKKTLIGVLALVMAVALLCGSLFAFFSDKLEGSGVVTVGTLDIASTLASGDAYVVERLTAVNASASNEDEKTTWEQYNDSDVLNPGDVLRIKIGVQNVGSKSAWLGTNIVFTLAAGSYTDTTSSLGDVKTHVNFYSAYTLEGTKIKFDEDAKLSTDASGENDKILTYTDTLAILDGAKEDENNHSETITSIDAKTPYEKYIYITLSEDAGNSVQGATISLNVAVMALQYRNNNTALPTWSTWINNLETMDTKTA